MTFSDVKMVSPHVLHMPSAPHDKEHWFTKHFLLYAVEVFTEALNLKALRRALLDSFGFSLDIRWICVGCSLDLRSVFVGCPLDRRCILFGYSLDLTWNFIGSSSDLCFGFSLDVRWLSV